MESVSMRKFVFAAAVALATCPAFAADYLAKVNGVEIPQTLFDEAVRQRIAAGAPDTPELKTLVKEELISRELLIQQARQLKLDQTPTAKAQREILEQNFLIELMFNHDLTLKPVTDAEVRAEYDKQVQEAKKADLQEYKLRDIVSKSEADAKAVIARLKKGESFAKVAGDKSEDPNRANGGELGWIAASQIIPPIRSVVANLSKGAFFNEPVQSNKGWHVVQLEDKRPFAPPAFEEIKNRLRQGMIQKRRAELIDSLKKNAVLE
jgi:peptidyl-prolyl cis-trans isomerase C